MFVPFVLALQDTTTVSALANGVMLSKSTIATSTALPHTTSMPSTDLAASSIQRGRLDALQAQFVARKAMEPPMTTVPNASSLSSLRLSNKPVAATAAASSDAATTGLVACTSLSNTSTSTALPHTTSMPSTDLAASSTKLGCLDALLTKELLKEI